MARRVSSFWPLNFDMHRSQSELRIATTAAPVSAAELEREWEESQDPAEDDDTLAMSFKSVSAHLMSVTRLGSRSSSLLREMKKVKEEMDAAEAAASPAM
ncbi:hypothetical protein KFL_002420165 [Klebsormidium nitens]|uniref:Uncharacterized protein n=1 Tax=Klebsormidium nitens TaxID=105231 RepID=A0A1Y1I511_KLENI|nr:hypothetical protein KFL_002420165 [Klebsormidium nitens]|eukprot:GAQ85583.1 hypothetical protein KFL_002420165 [Klebsormidium nitens]